MKQMFIHSENGQLQMYVLQDGLLVDYLAERTGLSAIVGNICMGRVVNVLPGMEAAFVDIGCSKNAFLYRDDLLHPHLEKQPSPKPRIEELVRPGLKLIVQVMKEPIGSKGARVTTHYSLPGRYLVYMPQADYVAVSRKVGSETERARLKECAEKLRIGEEGIIMRTAAAGESQEELAADVLQQRELWRSIEARSLHASAPSLLHSEADSLLRFMRDRLSADFTEIWLDDPGSFQRAAGFVEQMAPKLKDSLRLYDGGGKSMLETFKIAEQAGVMMQRSIPLKSGGYLIWEHTEALTVIDVNTGKYVGDTDLETTVFRTNMEAAEEIARLLRVRDAGGIIIIDFIDMELEEHREQIYHRLLEVTRMDHTKCTIVGWTKLGLFELTRKKSRDSSRY